MCACSGLWDSLSHRSFAGLTTQTQFHHNRFDKRPESVYRETQESRSDTAGNGEDTINAAFPSNRFFFFFFCRDSNLNSNRVHPQCIFRSEESWDTVYELWAACAGIYSACLHILYSHFCWRAAHGRPELWSWTGIQNGMIRSRIHFTLIQIKIVGINSCWWKIIAEHGYYHVNMLTKDRR